ncbi:MAG: glutamyl-tRNA synthetase, partial [Candidatus Saccharibacteria bacterium]|nr:glutamyl-tRNA synthetase [Candidatus Saccharibacteria bacterium]
PTDELLRRSDGFWPAEAKPSDDPYRLAVLKLVQDRLKYLSELPELTDFFFTDPQPVKHELTKNMEGAVAANALLDVIKAAGDADWTESSLEEAVRPLAEHLDLKTGVLFGLIRTAITGRTAAPGLFETMAVLGRETTLRRLEHATKLVRA